MKKTLLMIAAAFAFVACSNDETILQAQPEAIGFDNAFIENSTRSGYDPSWSNTNLFADFAVYGYVENAPLFDNVKVSGDALNGEWTYTNTQYWIAGAKYNFAAVAPYSNGAAGTFSVAADGSNYVGTTVLPFTNDGTNDVLYAQNAQVVGASDNNAKVAFTFRHILSKVKFSFENGYNASTATIKVYDVKIENAYETATATLGVNSTAWAYQASTLVLDFGNASDDENTDAKENAEVAYAYGKTYESLNERFLIPGNAPEITYEKDGASVTENAYKVTFKVDLLVNNTLVKTYNHTAYAKFAPVAGNAYDIKTVINAENIDPEHTQEPIEFTVTTINKWTEGTTVNM